MDNNNRLLRILLGLQCLLLLPFLAMQLSAEVNWMWGDFLVMGLILAVVGLLFEGILRLVKQRRQRIILGVTILVLFLLVWAELAVGIFGTPFAGS